jgi:hypothetical protein
MKKQPSVLNYFSPFIMIALGVCHSIRHGVDLVTIIPIVLGVFALYLALFNHFLLQCILTFLMKIWYPIGQAITLFLFTVTFYVLFTPVGIVLRIFKKDILNRNFKSNHPSYWINRSIRETNHYTQQF